MKKVLYKFLFICSKIIGVWFFIFIARIIALGFFLFFPKRRAQSMQFYKAMYPEKHYFYYLFCSWNQYKNFTYSFINKFFFSNLNKIKYTSQGLELLESAIKNKEGGIILMSHMGNWEIAAHLLKQQLPKVKLMFLMGRKANEQVEDMQKENLSKNDIKILTLDKESDSGSFFDLVEGINFVKNGGFISMTGDMIWNQSQRKVTVDFLKHQADFPATPHIFAYLSKMPLYLFFCFKINKNKYHFVIKKPKYVKSKSRQDKDIEIKKSAQYYADILEEELYKHPFQWYNFNSILKKNESSK